MRKIISVMLVTALVMGCLSACGTVDEMLGGELADIDNSTTLTSETPGTLQFYEALQDNEVVPFTLTEKAKLMLSENDKLFLENKNDGLTQYTDSSLTYKVLTKNIEKHGDKLIYLPEAYVLSINETELDSETTFSELHLLDSDGNSFYLLSLSAYADIYEEDTVSVYALPIGETSFENVGGGTTLAIMLAACYIEEIE